MNNPSVKYVCFSTPYMREIIDCFDVNSPVREVNVKKGCALGWSTSFPNIRNQNNES